MCGTRRYRTFSQWARYVTPAIAKETMDFLLRQDKESVEEAEPPTERQREVLQLLAEGKSMKEVVNILNVTTSTVAFHKDNVMKALHAQTDADQVRYAIKNHVVVGSSGTGLDETSEPQIAAA